MIHHTYVIRCISYDQASVVQQVPIVGISWESVIYLFVTFQDNDRYNLTFIARNLAFPVNEEDQWVSSK